jgi:DNA repair protein RecO (recombination protein O)
VIEKTQAIVLRVYPFSNTSRIVSWLTPESGKIATLVKGSQRPKSFFLGQYDLFYTCELVFYGHERAGVHITRECAPLKTRDRFRSDWKATAAASYLSDLLFRVSPPDAPHHDLFDLLDLGLDHLAARGAVAPFLFWFELKLLGTLGLAPRLKHCLNCAQDLMPSAHRSKFSYSRGGIFCCACAETGAEGSLPIAPDILALLTGWQRARSPQAALSTQCTTWQLGEIEKLLGLFLAYHLDTSLLSRGIALDVMKRKAAA